MVVNWYRIVKIFCFILLFSGLGMRAMSCGFNQFWQEFYVHSSIGKKASVGLLFNNLYSVEFGNYDWFVEGNIRYAVKPWLDIEALYRQEYYTIGSHWTYEKRSSLRASGKKSYGIWKFRNRHRFEIRFFENSLSRFRYRSDLKVSPQWDFTTWQINPYIQEEIFVNNNILSRVRSYIGFQGKKKWFEPSVYLMIQSDNRANKWGNVLIGGFVLGVAI